MSTEPKPAAPAAKRPSKTDDDEPAAKAAPAAKPGFFPTGLSRAIVLGALLLSISIMIATLVPQRYKLVAAPRSDNALVYRINTLTGRMSVCSTAQCTPITEKDSAN